ncbi:hypothetical protein HRQ91_10140 [Treponema parvum]|uniref:Uncharacterized protein n=1 Tax=Treponema parvum TaxID=138851 RepID=A0A975F5Q4_9SPIR|nr:hypothetical protein [Treponema parvum]QTQ14793.1 hypothetical protein HRQ91_10140 [Treponema parvum]
MDNAKIKQILLDIQGTDLDFTVTMTGKASKKVNGLYKPETYEILLHNKNFKSDNQLVYTAVHEYTHHLINEKQLAESGGRQPPKGSRIHTQAFWAKFHELLEIAEQKGYYVLGLENSPELEALTEKIKKEYIETNGRLMQEFGKLLAKAHELCEAAGIRYEDYIDRILCLPRASARDITRTSLVPADPAVGFDNMKLLSQIKRPDERAAAEQQLLSGKAPDTVRAMLKKKAEKIDPKEKLERERDRLNKMISSLTRRLEFVEESLAQM